MKRLLFAAAALASAVTAGAASAHDGYDDGYRYAPDYGYHREWRGHDDRRDAWRRAEEWRRDHWRREHAYRYGRDHGDGWRWGHDRWDRGY